MSSRERKVVSVLRKLNVYELNAFYKYIVSPYFNSNGNLSALYGIIKDHIQHHKPLPSDEHIWNILLPETTYDDTKYRKLYSDLLKQLQRFLGLQELEKDPYAQLLHETQAMGRRGLKSLFSSTVKQLKHQQERSFSRSAEFYLNNHLAETLLYSYRNKVYASEKERQKVLPGKLNMETPDLHAFFALELLKIFVSEISKKYKTKIDLTEQELYPYFRLIKRKKLDKIPAIRIYTQLIKLYTEPDNNNNYFQLKNSLWSYIELFTDKEVKEILDGVIGYSITKMNQGDLQFVEESFNLYSRALEIPGYISDNKITPTTVRNITAIALRLGKYEWVEEFIPTYIEYLPEEERNNAIYFNLARVSFYKSDYRDVISKLMEVDYADIWYNLNSKLLLIAAYYELNEYDAYLNASNSLKVFLSREKSIPSSRKKNYTNYLTYLHQLSRIEIHDIDKLSKLKDKVISTKGLASKTWLLEKILEKEKIKKGA